MPYKARGKGVYKKENGKWTLVKMHESHAKAVAHLTALVINVVKPELKKRLGKLRKSLGDSTNRRP